MRKQVYGFGGGILSLVGVTLVGLTVWRSIQVEYSDGGLSVKLETIEQRLELAEEKAEQTEENLRVVFAATRTVTESLSKIAQASAVQQDQLASLAQHLRERGSIQPQAQVSMDRALREAPSIDQARLNITLRELDRRPE